MALPLAFFAFDSFGWTFASFCNHQFGNPVWRVLDVVFMSLAPAVILHVVLTFVGRLRAWMTLLRATYAGFGALALSSVTAACSSWGVAWIESSGWAVLFLVAWLPSLVFELWLLLAHLRSGIDADEQARTRLVLAALAIGGSFATTDLWSDLGVPLPSLTPLGSLFGTALLAVVALRFRLFDRNLQGTTALYAGSVGVTAVLVYLTLFHGLKGNLPALTFGVTVVTLVLAVVVREAASSLASYRERVERLAVLGRFSAQMAHDVKNPLAALVGAVQVLEAGESDPHLDTRAFRSMIVEQADRIRAIVEKYDRLGRVEPVPTLVRVNDLVTRVAALSRYATSHEVKVSFDLDARLGECEVDADLLSGALENIVRNALEAMKSGGMLVVTTRGPHGRPGERERDTALVIAVQDSGEGMDVRQAERAFDDFYTTKSTGSGLGLAFARRVALAHGGDVLLSSSRGSGTLVELRLPARLVR
ncbi:Flagellar sensor histidine kinase FleS [Labilithrix luteola]|uniref:histidine kinase n=1 Tax=Labilithrix luteola TaxID=1391654 RepID=A0A0K1PVE2_9BACT|nr:ATP-binding protein [Labilithrix luteola]AKU97336.1 Flagellar sensor histidine kinase FleS [Labilithrix luteola]